MKTKLFSNVNFTQFQLVCFQFISNFRSIQLMIFFSWLFVCVIKMKKVENSMRKTNFIFLPSFKLYPSLGQEDYFHYFSCKKKLFLLIISTTSFQFQWKSSQKRKEEREKLNINFCYLVENLCFFCVVIGHLKNVKKN